MAPTRNGERQDTVCSTLGGRRQEKAGGREERKEREEREEGRADVPGLINTQALGARIAGGSQLGRRRQAHPWTWTLDGEHSPFPVRAGSPLLGGPFGLAGRWLWAAGCGLQCACVCVCLYIWPEARPGTAVGTYSWRLIPRFPTEVTGSRSTLVPLPSPAALDAIGCLGPLGIGPAANLRSITLMSVISSRYEEQYSYCHFASTSWLPVNSPHPLAADQGKQEYEEFSAAKQAPLPTTAQLAQKFPRNSVLPTAA
ncbi:predicted protein [Histoplasma capsulatum G186AR]|uniref:Uncharacterized protein n=1 Tax=Ajellomyces capsulatus (strain G186AR / H82 / ATCC MYA-2454 / RMSCC 2432) TaxID=447093 RepID=C0NCE6_AJECG|nr:uncharacterized protein HCBG_00792 [Histoplasma capsulatum G186AR]EEH11337.1 predicted protein [Histoplasma capsulatum G186AR]